MKTNQLCLMIAGVSSGVGKTTISTGLMHALVARGLRVQGFKVGPDYIDPTYHRRATGRPSYNLDTWLNGPEDVLRCFESGMRDADVAIIEGVMGLFDGRKETKDDASTAEMARLLDVPVFLVVDTSKMGQSVAAVIHGYQQLDPRVHIAGVILNQVASENHENTLRYATAAWTNVPIVGVIRRGQLPSLPERHLGLVPSSEHQLDLQQLGNVIEQTIQIDQLLLSARQFTKQRSLRNDVPAEPIALSLPPMRDKRPYRLGLALDRAFSFYYPEVLEHFSARGIDVIPFSPLEDSAPPSDIDVCYLGGGFPEIFAAQLASNEGMLAGLRSLIARGMRVYGECGGYMYLGKACIDQAGLSHPLLDVVPYEFRMGKQRAQLGYREVVTRRETLLGPAKMQLRGHEFHWSSITDPLQTEHTIYDVLGEKDYREEGFANRTIVASYIHLPLKSFVSVLTNLFHFS